MISAPSCSEMAHSKTFITPQGRKREAIVVPGWTYIMEFEVGFQTALNSKIKCQGQDILLDSSIQKGIIQHIQYIVQIEHEIFEVTGDKIMAMSSAEKLQCNPLGPASGCVGALHTYAWSPPKSSCQYRVVREVQGLFAPTYFAADEAQLYYELKGGQTLPFSCGAHKVHATNMKDILVMRMDENAEVKMININLADMSNAAEIRSLSLFCLLQT